MRWVGEKVAEWGEEHMGKEYSYIGAVVGATYPEMGKVLRKADAEDIYPCTGLWCTGRKRRGSCSLL